jgi:hypothetical protein
MSGLPGDGNTRSCAVALGKGARTGVELHAAFTVRLRYEDIAKHGVLKRLLGAPSTRRSQARPASPLW